MEPEIKKAMLPLLLVPIAYILLIAGIFYSVENDTPYIGIACAVIAMVVVVLALRSFFLKTILKGKVPYSPIRTLKPISDDEETRDIRITVSGYNGNIRFKLYIDDIEIADTVAGDRLRIPLTSDAHTLVARDGVTADGRLQKIGMSHFGEIPAGGDHDIYIWCNRRAKKVQDVVCMDVVTGGLGALESEDAASFAKFRRTMMLTPILGSVGSIIAIVVALMLP